MYKRAVAITGLIFTLGGCSSTPTDSEISVESKKINSDLSGLHALLEKNESGYRFTLFSEVASSNEPWVSLDTLQPTFNKNDIECKTASMLGHSVTQNKLCDEEKYIHIFRSSTQDGGDLATNTFIGGLAVLTWGLTAPVSNLSYTSTFDQSAYDVALGEALINIDLDFLQKKYMNYKTTRVNFKKQEQLTLESKIKQLKQNSVFEVKDYSELLKLKPTNENVSYKHTTTLDQYVAKPDISIEKMTDQLSDIYKENRQLMQFKLFCDTSDLRAYTFETTGCGDIFSYDDKLAKHNVTFSIINKKYQNIDYHPAVSDSSVKIYFKNDQYYAENKTNSYVMLDSISIYFKHNIETIEGLKKQLPPFSDSEIISGRRFNKTKNLRVFKNTTKVELKIPVKAGIAVKYRVIDTNKERTLHKVNNIKPLNYAS